MSNTLYLVCAHHPDRVHSFRLAHRMDLFNYVPSQSRDKLGEWLADHQACGHRGGDHFKLAYEHPQDHDLPKPAPVADAVHLTLRNADIVPAANEPTP